MLKVMVAIGFFLASGAFEPFQKGPLLFAAGTLESESTSTPCNLAAQESGRDQRKTQFHRRLGVAADRSVKTSHRFDVGGMVVMVNGVECKSFHLALPQTIEQVWSIEDRPQYNDQGGLVRIRRRFAQASGSVESLSLRDATHTSIPLQSCLEGVTVEFGVTGANELTTPQCESVPNSILIRLREDMDFRTLLPQTPIAVGHEWTLEPRALLDILDPRRIGMVSEGQSPEACIAEWIPTGTIRAEFLGGDPDNDRGDLRLNLAGRLKITSTTEQGQCAVFQPEVAIPVEEVTEIEYALSGVLIWNQATGCLRTLRLSGSLVQLIRCKWQSDAGTIDLSCRVGGDVTVVVSAEPSPNK